MTAGERSEPAGDRTLYLSASKKLNNVSDCGWTSSKPGFEGLEFPQVRFTHQAVSPPLAGCHEMLVKTDNLFRFG